MNPADTWGVTQLYKHQTEVLSEVPQIAELSVQEGWM